MNSDLLALALVECLVLLLTFGWVLLIFLDYHKLSNIHKGALFAGAVIAAVWLVLKLPQMVTLALATASPALMFVYVLVARKRKKP